MECLQTYPYRNIYNVIQYHDEDIKNLTNFLVLLGKVCDLPEVYTIDENFKLVLRPCQTEAICINIILHLFTFLEAIVREDKTNLVSLEKWEDTVALVNRFFALNGFSSEVILAKSLNDILRRIVGQFKNSEAFPSISSDDPAFQDPHTKEIILNNLGTERYTLRCMQIAHVSRIIYLKISLRILGIDEDSLQRNQLIDLKEMDWKIVCPNLIEELAMTIAISRAFSSGDQGAFADLLLFLTKSKKTFSIKMKGVLQIWQLYRLALIANRIYHFFHLRFQRFDGMFTVCKTHKITPYSKCLTSCFQRNYNEGAEDGFKNLTNASESLDLFNKDIVGYLKDIKVSDALYKKYYWELFEGKKIEFAYTQPYRLIEGLILSPKEYAQLKICPISMKEIDEFLQNEIFLRLDELTQAPESSLFKKITEFSHRGLDKMPLIQKEKEGYLTVFPDFIEEFAHTLDSSIDDLSSDIKKMHIQKPVRQSPKKRRSRHRGHRKNSCEQGKEPEVEQKEKIKPISACRVKKVTVNLKSELTFHNQFKVHKRVLDWFLPTPKAWTFPRNKLLSSEDKKILSLFHSYPFAITEKVLTHGLETEWYSKRTKKYNRHFCLVGQIKIQDLVIQGIFTECFDKETFELYHHCFTKQTFNYVVDSYQKEKISELQNAIEQELYQEDDESDMPLSVQKSKDKIVVEIGAYVTKYIVNDEVEYTICTPLKP